MSNPWLQRFANRPLAATRLFCFTPAGAGATAYRAWGSAAPQHVEVCAVQLPGRESRLRETAFTSIARLVDALVHALAPHFDRPFAFFGHSMGALVAFELARALHAQGGPRPAHLMVSGRRPPHLAESDPLLHHQPDDEFIEQISRRYGGIPEEILREREVLEVFLPALRADITAIETHRFTPGVRLDCPIAAFGGEADARVWPHQLGEWQAHTSGPVQVRTYQGGHFFLSHAQVREDLVREAADRLWGALELRPEEARPA